MDLVRSIFFRRRTGSRSYQALPRSVPTQAATALASHYLPLPHKSCTRLVVLQPGRYDDKIRCSMKTIDLDAEPSYIALSYTWGSKGDEAEIFVDEYRVWIRRNLCEALRAMRDSTSNVTLWIDALSISQSNLEEKSQQVANIGRIFSHAIEVRAWLGEHADGSQTLFHDEDIMTTMLCSRGIAFRIWFRKLCFALMAAVPAATWIGLLCLFVLAGAVWAYMLIPLLSIPVLYVLFWRPNRKWIQAGYLSTKPAVHEYAHFLKPLRKFLARPYWSRTWIIQEIGLADSLTLYCGNDCMPWTTFATRFLGFEFDELLTSNEVGTDWPAFDKKMRAARDFHIDEVFHLHIGHVFRIAFARYNRFSIIDLAPLFNYTKCSTRLDRIYALLSLEQHQQPGEAIIVPDYNLGVVKLATQVFQARLPVEPKARRPDLATKITFCLDLTWRECNEVYAAVGLSKWSVYRPRTVGSLVTPLYERRTSWTM